MQPIRCLYINSMMKVDLQRVIGNLSSKLAIGVLGMMFDGSSC